MAEDRPVSTANTEYATPPPSLPPPLPVVDSAPLEAPLDVSLDVPLEPPRASFLLPGPSIASSPRDSRADSTSGPENEKEGFTPGHSTTLLPVGKPEGEDAEAPLSQPAPKDRPIYRRPAWLAIAAGALVAVVLAIALPVALTHKTKHNQSNNSSQPGSGSGPGNGNSTNPKNPSNAITGGDGSTVTSGNTTFVYKNPYGGFCEFLFLHKHSYVCGRPTGAT
jgi:glucan 1,3-beta-glucosidase